jgi:hypothetical protein
LPTATNIPITNIPVFYIGLKYGGPKVKNHFPQNDVEKDGNGVSINSAPDPTLDSFHSKTKNLKAIFTDAQKHTKEEAAVLILGKCFEANKAKLIYEFCQTPEFAKAAEEGLFGTMPQRNEVNEVVRTAKDIAFNKYKDALAEFCKIRSENPQEVTNKARRVLGGAAIHNNAGGFSTRKLFDIRSDANLPSSNSPQPQKEKENSSEVQEKKPTEEDAIKAEAEGILKELFSSEKSEESAKTQKL